MRYSLVGVASAFLMTSACSGGDGVTGTGPGAPQTNATVQATTTNTFSPGTVTIAQNGSVTWQFATEHEVDFADVFGAPEDIPPQTSGSASRSFASVGTFSYVCGLHPGMSGSVSVVSVDYSGS